MLLLANELVVGSSPTEKVMSKKCRTEENKTKNKGANKQKMIEKKGEGNSRKYALWKYVIL